MTGRINKAQPTMSNERCRICGETPSKDAVGNDYCNNFHCTRYDTILRGAEILYSQPAPAGSLGWDELLSSGKYEGGE